MNLCNNLKTVWQRLLALYMRTSPKIGRMVWLNNKMA